MPQFVSQHFFYLHQEEISSIGDPGSCFLDRRCCSLSCSVPLLQVSHSLPPSEPPIFCYLGLCCFPAAAGVKTKQLMFLNQQKLTPQNITNIEAKAKADSSKHNKQQAGSGKCVGVDLTPSVVTSYIFYFKPTKWPFWIFSRSHAAHFPLSLKNSAHLKS